VLAQLNAQKAQQAAYNNRLNQLNKQISRLKGQKGTQAKLLLNAAQHQVDIINKQMTSLAGTLTATQNKYYTVTGQYDKLLSGTSRDAYLAIQSLFKNYGLESLAGKIYDYVKNGYSSDTISILLSDTPEYKARFAANEARIKAGLPALSPADYINTENSYRAVMRAAGMPPGFYDSVSDFTGFLEKDVSPTELQSRVDLANQATNLASPYYKQALNQMGIDDAHLAAHFLDPDAALPLLQKAAATAAVGAAALSSGLTFDQSYATQLAQAGVSAQTAQQGYQHVANEMATMRDLGAAAGTSWTQSTAQQAEFGVGGGAALAASQKAGIVGAEKGAFSGPAGAARTGLSQSKEPTSQR
jgi:hypothetical protein